jgi:hypothetical protein
LLLEPLSPINKVFSLVLQEERQRAIFYGNFQTSQFTDSLALLSRTSFAPSPNFKQQPNRKNKPTCSHCGVVGHTVEKCYRIHGFPPGFQFTRTKPVTGSSANQVQATESSSMPSPMPFTQAQCQQLLAFMQNNPVFPNSPFALQASGISNTTTSDRLTSSTEGKSVALTNLESMSLFSQYFVFSSCHTTISCPSHAWIIDTGATDHMVNSIYLFTFITATISTKIKLSNGHFALVTHVGTVQISTHLTLTDVLCVPSFSFNLLSVSKLVKTFNFCFLFLANYCLIQKLTTWTTIGVGKEANGLFYLLEKPESHQSDISSSCNFISLSFPFSAHVKSVFTNIWHYRLGHLSPYRLRLLHSNNHHISCELSSLACTICLLARHKRLHFPSSITSSVSAFDLIHCDIWGPYSTSSRNGHHYFLTIVDDYSHFTWIHLMKFKDQTRKTVQDFFHFIETQFHSKIKILRLDNGQEFAMTDFYSTKGVLHQLSCVESPQQNAVVERKHQHLLNVVRSLHFQANLFIIFWGDCVLTTAYLINRIPTPHLSNTSPYELLYHTPRSYDHLKVFGYHCYASTLSRNRTKFDPRAKPCMLLGYPFQQKGYKLFDLHSHSIFISRDVVFHESIFPFAVGLHNPSSNGVFLHSSSSSSFPVIPSIIPNIPSSLNPIPPQIDSSSPYSSSTHQLTLVSSLPIIEHNSFIP